MQISALKRIHLKHVKFSGYHISKTKTKTANIIKSNQIKSKALIPPHTSIYLSKTLKNQAYQ